MTFIHRKRHHEDNPYSSTDNGDGGLTSHSMPKRLATRNNSHNEYVIMKTKTIIYWRRIIQISFISSTRITTVPGNYSPPSSTGSDSSSSSANSALSTNSIHTQLCICPSIDCVIHDHRRSTTLPQELTSNSNPTYGNNNLLLYYAHLERCRRYGQNIHQNTSSS